jgi:hypothetical protein
MNSTPIRATLLFLGLAASLSLAACAGAAAPPGTSSPSVSAFSQEPGGGAPGDPGSGVGGPVGGPVDSPPADPGSGAAKLVIARPGQLKPHPVAPTLLEPSVDGRRVLVKVTWWSGVEPCNVLDSVKVDRSATEVVLTLIEGSSDLNAICIEIAEQKSTIVDLGELEPGDHTISAPGGEAKPVTVTVT